MVGVPKSTGCAVCRKRKIKCDETWPTCVNCQKNGKCCPGPPQRHTFKDLGPKLTITSTVTSVDETTGDPEDQPGTTLTQLNEKWSKSGAVFQKFRISNRSNDSLQKRSPRSPRFRASASASPPHSAFLRHPSPSQHLEMSRALVHAMNTGGVGHRLSAFGAFMREVPARIGHNAALDAAAACLINAHYSLVHQKNASEIANTTLYLRALQTLQTCLEDPKHGMSPNTLCASVLLCIVEALAGPRIGNRYLTHVGGAGRLMELQGAENCSDSFVKGILMFNRCGMIITSVYERKSCFLTSPEWRDIAFDKTGLSFDDCLYIDIVQHMAAFPAFLRELKDLDNVPVQVPDLDQLLAGVELPLDLNNPPGALDSPLPESTPSLDFTLDDLEFFTNPYPVDAASPHATAKASLLNRLTGLKAALDSLGVHLNAKLADGSTAIELPSIEEGSPIPTSFHFTNWRVTVAYNCFWALLILTNKVIMKLLPSYDPMAYALEAECRTVAFEICKSWEDAWACKPIGAFHTGLSFVVAYEYCTPDVQEWILKGLNALLDNQMVESFRWTSDIIAMMSGKLSGEGPDLVFSLPKQTNK